jgi:hypothetical protein
MKVDELLDIVSAVLDSVHKHMIDDFTRDEMDKAIKDRMNEHLKKDKIVKMWEA